MKCVTYKQTPQFLNYRKFATVHVLRPFFFQNVINIQIQVK